MLEPKLIELPKIIDERGNLSFVESHSHIPFSISRVYTIYDVPGGEHRPGHAYKHNEEFIIALSGSFNVVVRTLQGEKTFHLNRSYYGLYIPSMAWRSFNNFSTNSVCMVLASLPYDPSDYIRNEYDFLDSMPLGPGS